MIDWANEHKSSNDYSEFVKIYSRDDHRYKNWNYSDVEPISRTEAIKKVEEEIETNQNKEHELVIMDTLNIGEMRRRMCLWIYWKEN